jgi:hypothetical protein
MDTDTIPNAYTREHGNLRATSLTREMHEHTCGYWFTVTSGAMAHTAFRTRNELDVWLAERGLTLSNALLDAGEWSTTAISGSYRTSLDRDIDRFDAIIPLLTTRVMDNGQFTPAKITEDEWYGIRTVHYMNVNYR